MIRYIFVLFLFVQWSSSGQTKGKVYDKETGVPLSSVNVWVKGKLIGTITDENGYFSMSKASITDSISFSSLGYNAKVVTYQKELIIQLEPDIEQLDEVTIIRSKKKRFETFKTFKKPNRTSGFYNQSAYLTARYIPRSTSKLETSFVHTLYFTTVNYASQDAVYGVYLLEATKEEKPTNQDLSDVYRIISPGSRISEQKIDLSNEYIQVPEQGFFVVVERYNLPENKTTVKSNTIGDYEIFLPAFGRTSELEKNTWMFFGGEWKNPKEVLEILGVNKNLAVNIKFSN